MSTIKGTVKFFNESKGFGFISGEDGEDYFVHISQVDENLNLDSDMEVSFEPKQTDRGIQAFDVRLC